MNISRVIAIDVDIHDLVLPCIFRILPKLAPSTHVIFGFDLLQKFNSVPDLSRGNFSFYNDLLTVSLQNHRSVIDNGAKIIRHFTLQHKMKSILALNVPTHLQGDTLLLEPVASVNSGTFAVARALVIPKTGKINCRF